MSGARVQQGASRYPLLFRLLLYGLLGWAMEIFWTGFGSLLRGDFSLEGHTYLWMFPIYGLAVLLENVHESLRDLQWWERGIVWIAVIWTLEFGSGYVIKLLTGACPWDYSASPYSLAGGLIRLDYAPVWFAVGLLFEQLHNRLKTS